MSGSRMQTGGRRRAAMSDVETSLRRGRGCSTADRRTSHERSRDSSATSSASSVETRSIRRIGSSHERAETRSAGQSGRSAAWSTASSIATLGVGDLPPQLSRQAVRLPTPSSAKGDPLANEDEEEVVARPAFSAGSLSAWCSLSSRSGCSSATLVLFFAQTNDQPLAPSDALALAVVRPGLLGRGPAMALVEGFR